MNGYQATVEARGYGDVAAEAEALEAALADSEVIGEDLTWTVLADEDRGMLMVRFDMEGVSALDVHELVFQVWQDVWDEAFPESPPTEALAIRCTPVAVEAAS